MRQPGTMQIPCKDKMQARVAVTIDVQRLYVGQHKRAVRRLVKRRVKIPVPTSPGLYLRVVLERFFELLQDAIGLLKISRLHVWDCATQHVALENGARLK